jgi:two-component system LytT family sensor kinase
MLIKNCIKFTIISEEKPLTINIYLEAGYLIVKNNIQKRKTLGTPSVLCLKNNESRFKFLTDQKTSIVEDKLFYCEHPDITIPRKIK